MFGRLSTAVEHNPKGQKAAVPERSRVSWAGPPHKAQAIRVAQAGRAALNTRPCLDSLKNPGSFAQVAQSVEQWTENPRVGGSIPSLGTVWLGVFRNPTVGAKGRKLMGPTHGSRSGVGSSMPLRTAETMALLRLRFACSQA